MNNSEEPGLWGITRNNVCIGMYHTRALSTGSFIVDEVVGVPSSNQMLEVLHNTQNFFKTIGEIVEAVLMCYLQIYTACRGRFIFAMDTLR